MHIASFKIITPDEDHTDSSLTPSQESTSAGEIVDHPPDTILWIDADGRLFSIQDSACKNLGYRHEELLGLHWDRVHTKLAEKDWPRIWKRTRRVGQWAWRTNYRRKDGSELPVEVTASFLTIENRECVLTVARDISDLLRAEEERHDLRAQILHTQKLESLGILAGGIAHDFNNLLVGILGNASLAKAKLPEGSAPHTHLEEVETTTRRAADLVSQMLAYSGKGQFRVEVFDLNDLIREMAKLLSVAISKKAQLKLQLSETSPLVEGDPTQVRQVVMNLITNASEAIGNETGSISISTGIAPLGQTELAAPHLRPGRYVYLEISDTGCGMGEEVKRKLFDPFFTTKSDGRGLGMAAVAGIIQNHGGTIHLESEVGSGSVFRVLFPICERRLRPSPDQDRDPLGTWRGHGSILVVDDEKVIRLVATKALEQAGFKVLLAKDGIEALEVYSRHAREIVAVLLDIAMPRLDGIETLYELRCRHPDLHVLLSSGYSEEEIVPAFTSRRFASYLKKPYQPAELVDCFRDLLETTQSSALRHSSKLSV